MAKDLRSFINQKQSAPRDPGSIGEMARQFEGKSEAELMEQLMQSVQKGKEDGSFTPQAAQAFADRVSPMLNPEQRERLSALLGQITRV